MLSNDTICGHTASASRLGICSMMLFSTRIAFSAGACFFPYLSFTCSSNSSTCNLKTFDLNVSDVYTPSWGCGAGRLTGFCALIDLTAGVDFTLALTDASFSGPASSSSWLSSSSIMSSSSRSCSPFSEESLPSVPSSSAPSSDCVPSMLSKSAKLPSLSSSASLCSSFLRFVAGGAIVVVSSRAGTCDTNFR
jgi:hypothetical protein